MERKKTPKLKIFISSLFHGKKSRNLKCKLKYRFSIALCKSIVFFDFQKKRYSETLSPFEKSRIPDFVSCLCDKLITFLLKIFSSVLLYFNLALLSFISSETSESLLLSSESTPLTNLHALLTSSLSLSSKSRYKCLFATRFLAELKEMF